MSIPRHLSSDDSDAGRYLLGELLRNAPAKRAAAPIGRHRADEEPDVFDVEDQGDENDAEDGYGA